MKQQVNFLLFWGSQSLSQLGSAMSGFALILWVYRQTGSAMPTSLLTFFSYLPMILASTAAGPFVDMHKKKTIMLLCDLIAALCSCRVLAVLLLGRLELWHIYVVNGIVGLMNAFQIPAHAVAVGLIAPGQQYGRVSGLNSFSSNLCTVAAPMLAAALYSIGRLSGVVLFDLCTFLAAELLLLLRIRIPEDIPVKGSGRRKIFAGCAEGFRYLAERRDLLLLIAGMAVLNFFSRLTYENILSPMVLARSGGSETALGTVNAVLGLGGILGGLAVSAGKLPESDPHKLIWLPAAFSFLFGDLLMGFGRGQAVWCVAAAAASIPIPFLSAGQNIVLYRTIPKEMQGRVFAVRNALQYSTIPAGILLGGWLADFVFEPYLVSGTALSQFLQQLVGAKEGSGMAVMFLCTGTLGAAFSLVWYGLSKKHGPRS